VFLWDKFLSLWVGYYQTLVLKENLNYILDGNQIKEVNFWYKIPFFLFPLKKG